MSKQIPAFPFQYEDGGGSYIQHPGMTLRDWFAGQALMGYVMADPLRNDPDKIAAYAYGNADAMLAAISKVEEK